MWQSNHQFYAALETHTGDHIADVRLNVDWIPALQWAEFEQKVTQKVERKVERKIEQTVNGQQLRPATPRPPVIEPLWSATVQAPYLSGIGIRPDTPDATAVEFPLRYFADAVSAASVPLVSAGTLLPGQPFEYKIFALPNPDTPAPRAEPYHVVAVDDAPAIGPDELAPLLEQADRHRIITAPTDSTAHHPMPIFIPQTLLEEVTALGRTAGELETGGILVGRLWRDPVGTVFLRVTAQIRAEHTAATQSSLRFTPQTWVSVNAAIGLRGLGEVPLGWWHSHPFFCKNCTAEKRALCPFSAPAFSSADRDLHREVFQKSWNIALLLSFLGETQPSYDVFAWNRGQIAAANFYSLPDCVGK